MQSASNNPGNDPGKIDPRRMEHSALLLMAVNQHWGGPNHAHRLETALEVSREIWRDVQLALADEASGVPIGIRNNLLIVSVYAEGKLDDIAQSPSQEKVGSLIELTRSLAFSLREWRSAA
jgi:flagellar biosynthesis regulator FlaF